MNARELLDADQVREVLDFMRQVDRILAVIEFEGEKADPRVDRLVTARRQARQERDFARADALRDELRAQGISLADSPSDTQWKKR